MDYSPRPRSLPSTRSHPSSLFWANIAFLAAFPAKPILTGSLPLSYPPRDKKRLKDSLLSSLLLFLMSLLSSDAINGIVDFFGFLPRQLLLRKCPAGKSAICRPVPVLLSRKGLYSLSHTCDWKEKWQHWNLRTSSFSPQPLRTKSMPSRLS